VARHSGDLLAAIESRLVPTIEAALPLARVPGMALAVAHNDGTFVARGFGVKHVDQATPVTEETLFHMASVTKPFVATAVMQLAERGQLDLEDPVARHLPYFRLDDRRSSEVTIRQLLSHTAGMPDVEDYGWDRPETDDGALERYVRDLHVAKLVDSPGNQHRYSNVGFEVLGDVIAKVSARSFEDYVTEFILNPLGMTTSTLMAPRANSELLATPHTLTETGDSVAGSVFPYNRAHAPSSTLCCNAREIALWMAANLNGGMLSGVRMLKPESLERMWTPIAQAQHYPIRYVGLSWFISFYRGYRVISHGGSDLGFNSMCMLLPERGIGISFMCNADYSPVQFLLNSALEVATTT
jgi:CubicO group peptidase (beta-lactamase class C family)